MVVGLKERVVGLKEMHQRRGVQAEAGAEGQARQRGAAEPRGEGSSAHTLSIADGTAEIASWERR